MDPQASSRFQKFAFLWIATFLSCCLGALPLQALDPLTPLHQYGRDSWTQQQGLSGSVIHGLYPSSEGYLWLNTSGGLLRFDGARFVPMRTAPEGQENWEAMKAIAPSPEGGLILRGRTSTLRMNQGRFSELIPPVALPDGSVRYILHSRSGDIWIGADNQIYRIHDGQMVLQATRVSWTYALLEDAQGTVWVGANSGLFAFSNGRVRHFPSKGFHHSPEFSIPSDTDPDSFRMGLSNCTALQEDGEGGLWVGTVEGLWRCKAGRLLRDSAAVACPKLPIYCLLKDRDGNLWAGTDGSGLMRWAGGRWTSFRARDGLEDDSVLSLAEDAEGSLWVGTRSGLVRFRDCILRTLTKEDGLSSDNVWTVVEGQDKALYISTANEGITRWKDGRPKVFTVRDGLARNAGGTLFASRDGSIWAGTDLGLSRILGDHAATFKAGGRLPGAYLPAITEDAQGLILARSDRNLYRFSHDRLSPFEVPLVKRPGPSRPRYVWYMHRDQEGTLWIAMTPGLYRLGAGDPPEKAQPTAVAEPVNTIGEDDQGYLWLAGSETPGFTKFCKRDGSVFRYTPEVGARVEGISRILADSKGNLWMGTQSGIAFFQRAELDALAQGRGQAVNAVLYGTLDGLKTPDCGLVGPQPAAWRARDGRMYFASRKGLVTVDPEHLPRNQKPPPVRIESVLVDGVPLEKRDAVLVRPGAQQIEIQYTALSLRVPSKVHFKYQLAGIDSDWVEAGTRRTAFYTRLQPGTYQFKVIACNDDGVWNLEGASLSLKQQPRFVQTIAFYFLMAIGTGAVLFGLHLFKLRRMHVRQRELAELVRERTRELRLEVEERLQIEEALREHRQHLEQVVQARTVELRETNTQLQREIIEHSKSEEQLRQAQKLESIGRLAGGVAHDFNNLLTIIAGYCDLWLLEHPSPPGTRSFAQEIKKAGEKAAALTRQLLAFSRKQVLSPEILDLNLLLPDLESMLARLLHEDIELVARLCSTPCRIKVDPGQFTQVVLNLGVNARDAMPHGGTLILETACVDLDATQTLQHPEVPPGSYVQVTVTDTGEGMNPETLARIFEPFFTTKELGKGTGLGLSTVFGIVKQSGGHIWTYSEVGHGTTFKIYFPRVDASQIQTPLSRKTPKRDHRGETILVVEDQAEVRSLMTLTLEAYGYHLLQASNGQEALELLSRQNQPVHLLLTDVVMPGMNGRELGRRVAELHPEIRVVYTSGYTENVVVHQGILEPGLHLLQKPFSPQELLDFIARSLE